MTSELSGLLIHPSPPAPVPWWPPAPGWWVLLCLLIALLLVVPRVARSIRQRRQEQARLSRALLGLSDSLPDREWLVAANTTVKRLLKRQGNEEATRLFGDPWLDHLCATYPRPNRPALEPLAADLYRPDISLSDAQRQALKHELVRWLRHNHV